MYSFDGGEGHVDEIEEVVVSDPFLETKQEGDVGGCETILADVVLDLFHFSGESQVDLQHLQPVFLQQLEVQIILILLRTNPVLNHLGLCLR